MPKINIQKMVEYWVKNADKKWQTVNHLFTSKDYLDSLFFCHLTLECLFKALFVKLDEQPAPFTHDLRKLSEDAHLDQLSAFNLSTRYPDYRMRLYRTTTNANARHWIEKTNTYRLWLKKLLQGKKH